MHRTIANVALAFIVFSVDWPLQGAEPAVNFNRDVRPILSNKCYACHGPDATQRPSDLRLDKQAIALAELESGLRAVVPGDAQQSEVFVRVSSHDPDVIMPPPDAGKKLTTREIQMIKRWIEQGASWGLHWSFIRPTRPSLPEVNHKIWPRRAIDYFTLARLEQKGWTPSGRADKRTLIRRVTLTLIGLPPSLAEVDAFLADDSRHAYEKLVDRLLQSPRYGEHRARYWLDAARYGDTHGLHLDNERSIWRYRDWVIDAVNRNLPFDQFTIEQLAGDLLPGATLEQRIATGFHRCNVTTSEGGAIAEEFLARYAVERVETTSTVWLGLTVACAACHDHKFDPISQKEFYQLYAYFYNLTEKAMDGNALLPPPSLKAPTHVQQVRHQRLQGELAALEQDLQARRKLALSRQQEWEPRLADLLGPRSPTDSLLRCRLDGADDNTVSVSGPDQTEGKVHGLATNNPLADILAIPPAKRTELEHERLVDAYLREHVDGAIQLFRREQDLRQTMARLENRFPSTLVMRERHTSRDAHVLIRGQYDQQGEKVLPDVPAVLPRISPDTDRTRLALARWLVRPDHPLTARVTVNRIWQQHFGVGLVKSAEDFGSRGQWPSHPELLDHLATRLIDSGWDIKALHRLIVTSATFQQSSHMNSDRRARDPENRYLWRGPRFRLDAEVIRDLALSVSGLLVGDLGGPSVKPYQPDGLWKVVAYPTSTTANFQRDKGSKLYRRGMYTFWKRTSPPPSMQLLDAPSREVCTIKRPRTNTPGAALLLMNDVQFLEAARKFAERILIAGGDSSKACLGFAYRTALSRSPKAAEYTVLEQMLRDYRAVYEADAGLARQLMRHGDAPVNLTIDVQELAAWTMIASTIMNLDETISQH